MSSRRAAAAAGFLLAGALTCVPGTGSGAVQSASTAPGPVVTLTTANIRVGLPAAAVRHDMERARSGSASVVLLQELWHWKAARFLPPDWAAFQTGRPVPGCRGTVVAWDRKLWAYVRGRGAVLARASYAHATRCAAVVILRHRATGLLLPIVDLHMTPHVEVAGRPRPLPERIAAYHRAVHAARDIGARLRARYGRALLGGDWNVDWVADHRVRAWPFPYRHLWRRWDSNWGKLPLTGPTHYTRRIDTLWWTERTIRPVSSATVGRTRSDHNFVHLTIRLLGT